MSTRLSGSILLILLFGQAVVMQADDQIGKTQPPRELQSHQPQSRVTLCHCPPGNTGNCHTIAVGARAASAHFAHGDAIGPCGAFPTGMETACCTVDACLDQVAPQQCEAMGGAPFGLCASCDTVACPNPGCIGATGNCTEPQSTPGCSDLNCCDQICGNNPFCCDVEWDELCAATGCMVTTDIAGCCSPDGTCAFGPSSSCTGAGGVVRSMCLGDADGDGIDEACTCAPPKAP